VTLIFDERTLRPRRIDADPVVRSVSAGRSLAGTEVAVATDTGYWTVDLSGIPVNTVREQRYWRALAAQLNGRTGTICVPVGGAFIAPWPLDANGQPVARRALTHSDGTGFSDGASYTQDRIIATIRAAALRATSVVIDLVEGQPLEPGHIFGVGEERAYKIVTAVVQDGAYACTITPPLRAAVAADTTARFDRPRVRCRLASDDGMRPGFDLDRFATMSVSFVEAL
jgi:hypothetical protein